MKNTQCNLVIFDISRKVRSPARCMPHSCTIPQFCFSSYIFIASVLPWGAKILKSYAESNRQQSQQRMKFPGCQFNVQDRELSVTISLLPDSPRSSYTKWSLWNFRIRFGHSACHFHRWEEKHLSFFNSHLCFNSWIKILKMFLFLNYLCTQRNDTLPYQGCS